MSLRPHYDFALSDLDADPGSRGMVFRRIPEGARVLDVGCDTGRFGDALTRLKGCQVDGIEGHPDAAQEAVRRLAYVVQRDVGRSDSFEGLAGYDSVLFLDVIEHLVDPWDVLLRASKVLRQGGQIHIVTPNIAHISVVRRLLRGRFDYAEHGTMDRTHLRWFTRSSLADSLKSLSLVDVTLDVVPVVPYVRSLPLGGALEALAVRTLPDLFGGSLVASAKRGLKHDFEPGHGVSSVSTAACQ
jgi:2-polyprenyl-3-methyl-5-hydroxy-6-metoxy-1,4-benzoquinol methylase